MAGQKGGDILKTVDVFDGEKWTIGKPLSIARTGFGLASHDDGFLYAVGGQGEGEVGALTSVERFDGENWSAGTDLKTNRYYFGLASYKGGLYAVGGLTADPPPSLSDSMVTSVEVFNGAKWSTLETSLSKPRYNFRLASYNGLLYAVGGQNDQGTYFKSVEVFDGKKWNNGTDLNTARAAFGLASYNGSLYAAGGGDENDNILDSVEVFDGSKWTPGPNLAIARQRFGLASL